MSADGTTIVGYVTDGISGTAFRSSPQAGFLFISTPWDQFSSARDVSADGDVVLGFGDSYMGVPPDGPFRWTPANDTEPLHPIIGANSTANALSNGGDVIVGAIPTTSYPTGEAYRWTAATGTVGLGVLPSHQRSVAQAMSADGTYVAGVSGTGSAARVFLWSQALGMQDLGPGLPGLAPKEITGVSVDGEAQSVP
ncbi:MAG: hypothetical protein GY711_05565 [bacterium]|nr:hypothetical protein [bacterium]